MTISLSTLVRNARLDAFETVVGSSAILKIFTGSIPANCAAADSGTLLSTLNLPSDWLSAASGGAISKSGTWSSPTATGTGIAGYFRMYASDGTTCGLQGTVTITSGGGDMELDNPSIAIGQTVTINAFTLTDGNP